MCGAPRGQHWLVASSAEPHGLENTRPACVRRWILIFSEFNSLSFRHGALFAFLQAEMFLEMDGRHDRFSVARTILSLS